MKITGAVLLVGGLCLASSLQANEDLVAANQNFGPRVPTATEAPAAPPPAAVRPAAPAQPAPSTVAPAAAVPSSPSADQALQDEVLRRQEAQIRAKALIDQGQKLYYDGKTEEAMAKLEEALKILPRAPATQIEEARAKASLSGAYAKVADGLVGKEPEKARQLANKALEYDRNNITAENVLIKLRAAEREALHAKAEGRQEPSKADLDQDPEHLARRAQIKKLFREGRVLLASGQLDEAEKRFKQVLLLDRYNDDASKLITEVNEQRLNSTEFAVESARARRMWEVSDAWLPSVSNEVKLPEMGETKPISFSKEQARITEKLNKIIFPDINFREAVISDVVAFLSSESRRLDEDKEGVNIVLGAGLSAPPPAPGEEGAVSPAGVRPVTLAMQRVPMIEALKYITRLANLKYRIEANAVLILPADAEEGQMATRTYPVNPAAFKELIATPMSGGTSTGGAIGDITRIGGGDMLTPGGDLKAFFASAGVPFPAGSTLVFNERTSRVVTRNTPENLEIFERVLAEFSVVPSQVEIEAKFVDVSQGDLNELGFDWAVGPWNVSKSRQQYLLGAPISPDTPLDPESGLPIVGSVTRGLRDSTSLPESAVEAALQAASGGVGDVLPSNVLGGFASILSDPAFAVVMKALAQKKSTDVLSAPRVTTISGAQAQIRVVQEFIYPSEYSQPTAGNGVITPSVPSAFRTREVGVILNCTPTVNPDGYTINLTLVPEVSEFRGFIDYSPGDFSQNVGGTNLTVRYVIQQPLFETRTLQTSVVVWDGQTVVLGGLIRDDVSKLDDKVPFLGDLPFVGRFFRSKVTQRSKRNLLIFVTARLIDPAGNPIHRPEPITLLPKPQPVAAPVAMP